MNVQYPAMSRVTIFTTKSVADDDTVRRLLADTVGGFTITYGVGGWSDADGNVVVEDSATIILMHPDIAVLRRAADAVAHWATLIGPHHESEVWSVVDRDVSLVKYVR